MNKKDQIKHELVVAIKKLANELGRTPTQIEFANAGTGFDYRTRKYFGNHTALVHAADLKTYREEDRLSPEKETKLIKQYKALCAKTEKIQGFFRHTLDLDEMFRRAGNPASIKLAAMPDTHVKFRDVDAVNCFIEFLKDYNPDAFVILGDFIDAEGISHWPSDSMEPRRLIPEIIEARKLLQKLVDAIPNANTKIFLIGNHSDWVRQALNKMPELFDGLAELGLDITVEKLLGLKDFGFDVYELNHLVQIGHAHFTHGIYTGGSHAKKHIDVFKCNIFYGHLHDTQSHNQTSVHGPMVAQSLGCLCRLDAKFLKGKPNNWEHAFGLFEFFPDGTFTYVVPRIINGKMSLFGKVYGKI